jgi:hypothetical protein
MRYSQLCKMILIPLLLPYTLFTGCSLVGYVVGASTRPALEGMTARATGMDSIDMGRTIRLHTYDHKILEGSYKGRTTFPGKSYTLWFDTLVARSGYQGFVPKLNQRITLRFAGRDDVGHFRGIDRGGILFQALTGKDTAVVALDAFEWIQQTDSLRLDSKTASTLVRNGSIPGKQVVLIQNRRGEELVPYETIERVEVLPQPSGGMAGLIIGAIGDGIAVGLASVSVNRSCNPH